MKAKTLSNKFRFEEHGPHDLVSCVIYKYICWRCSSSHYGQTERKLYFKFVDQIGITVLTLKKTKLSKENSIHSYL